MSDSRSPLQDQHLAELRDNRTRVAVYLVNGIKLIGRIESFDVYVLMLHNEGTQLVFKHAVSTIIPYEASQDVRPRAPRNGVRV